MYRFDMASATKTKLWRIPLSKDEQIYEMLVAPNERVAVATTSHVNPNGLRTYVIDFESETGKLLVRPNRHRGLIVRGWTADSRYLYLEPECDGGCEPYRSQPGRYYIYDFDDQELKLFYRARRFDDRGSPIDGMRFIAWLRDK